MVSIFTGAGTGFARSSASTLGSAGQLGQAATGRAGRQVSVNAATGALVIAGADEMLIGRGPDQVVGMNYDSNSATKWLQNWSRAVHGLTGTVNTAGSTVTLWREFYDQQLLNYDASRGAYVSKEGGGAYDELKFVNGVWSLKDGNTQATEYFENQFSPGFYAVTRVVDADGNTQTYTYGTGGGLTRITNANGDYTEITYVAGTWLTSEIKTYYANTVGGTSSLTRTRYTYDSSNRLASYIVDLTPGDHSIADGKTYVTSYTYDGTSKRIASITQTDGSVLAITYDASGRVLTLTETISAGVTRTTTLAYFAGYTTVTDTTGGVSRLDYDAQGQLTKITQPPAVTGAAGQTTQFAYNANGDVSSTIDPLGNTTTYTYDSNGNRLTETDRLGNTIWRSYSAKNELLTEWRYGSYYWSDAGQLATRYAYDSEGHLRYKLGADASVTEYRYTAAGDLEVVIEYPEHPYTGSLPFPNSVVTEAQLNAWRDALPDRSSTKITTHLYDARGNLTQTNRHTTSLADGNATAAGGISRTFYAYDQAGQLLSRQTDGELAETFVYDGLGRVVASTDRNQGTTTIVFNDAATQTVVTLGSGYVKTSTYDKVGNLITEAQSGSYVTGTSTSKYDKLGRLRQVTDATGFNSYFVYDKVGRLVAEVNHRGSLVEYRYDANNRLLATMRYTQLVTAANLATLANPDSPIEMSSLRPAWHPWDQSSWTTYDKEGRVTSTMDGTIRTYEYDASGRLVKTTAYYNGLDWNQILAFQANPPTVPVIPTADARDVVTRAFYDTQGRAIGTLDGEGYLTYNVYDLAGQLVQRISYFNRANASLRATGTIGQLLANQVGSDSDRRTHFVYDAQGLLRYEVDGHNQVVEYGYDGGRRLISTIRYAGSIAYTTDFTWDNVKALVTSSGLASAAATRRSWNVYDASGNLAYAIDPEGAVSHYAYNVSGQVTKTVQYAAARATATWPDATTMYYWAAGQNGNSANRVTRYYYTAAGQLKFTVDPEGYLSRTDYDGAGRTVGEYRWDTAISASDSTTIATIDALQTGTWAGQWYTYQFGGPVTDIQNAEGGWYGYLYLGSGQKQIELNVWTDSNYLWWQYDNFGKLVTRTDANGAPEGATTQYGYDGLGNLKTVVDGRGNATNRTFDKLGRVLTETDALGGVVSYEYNAFGEVTKVTDARGFATTNSYDRLGRLLSTTDALNNVTSNSYNVFGDLLTVTRGAATTTFEYDRLGRVVKTTDAEGHYEQYTLDAYGNRTAVRNKIGGVVTNSYDRRGLLVAEVLPMSSTDSNGNVIAYSVTNKFEYDARGNRTKKIEAFGLAEARTTTYFYDRLDRLVETRGNDVWTMSADWVNSTVATPSEKLKYDHRSRVIERTDALGGRTLYYYDQMGNVTVELGAAGTYTAFTYDKNGNVLTRRVYGTAVGLPTNAGGAPPAAPGGEYRETVHTYDALNRLKTTSVADIRIGAWNGSVYSTAASSTVTTSLDYDVNGNVVRTVDGNGVAAFAYYDKENRKIAEVDREGYLTFYTLDGEGNVTREDRYATGVAGAAIGSDPNALRSVAGASRVTEFTYDRNGRRLAETRLAVNAFALDGSNLLVNGAANATISYAYNGLGEVTQKTEANGDFISYTYDSTGRLIHENRAAYTDLNGASVRPTISYGYNGLNELSLTRQGGVAAAAGDRYTRYTYGAGGRVATMTDANGSVYTYYYDVAGNVMRESYYRYKADGNATIDSLLYTRDQLGRVTSQGLASWNGSAWVHGDRQNTAYNAYGDVSQRGVNGMWQEQLSYDKAGRLVKSNSGDGVWRFFAYDGNGNQTLTLESEGMDLAAYSVDGAIVTATVNGSVGGGWVNHINATIAIFDRRGQQTGTRQPFRELNAGTIQTVATTRTYNAYGEVTSETDARGYVTDFAYNSMGRLIQKQSPNVAYTNAGGVPSSARPVENYFYDISGRMIAADDANGNRVRRSLLAGTGHGGSQGVVTAEYHSDGGVFRTYYDVFGDSRILRDELGNDEIRYYDAMGRLTQQNHRGGLLVDYYAYDLLGQRIKHWNSFLGGGQVETTTYDMQGRVLENIAFGGDTTAFSYTWNGAISTAGMGSFGGWTKVAYRVGVGAITTQMDVYGRDVNRTDPGNHTSYYSYDKAGRLELQTGVTGQSQTTTYFNTGRVATIADAAGTGSSITGTANSITATYGYDANGNRTQEKYAGTVWNYDYFNGHAPETLTFQDATIGYDALGRITSFFDAGGARTFDTEFDLAGNVRRARERFPDLAGGGMAETDKWFTYDSMNRMIVANGTLVDGVIVRGEKGVTLTYDVAGRRRTATHLQNLMGSAKTMVWVPNGGGGGDYPILMPDDPPPEGGGAWEERTVDSEYTGDRREEYEYRADGYLMTIKFADQDYDGTGAYAVPIASMRAAVNRGVNARDAMGRVTSYQEYDERLLYSYNRFNVQYDAASRITHEEASSAKWETGGTATYLSKTDNHYYGPGGAISSTTVQNLRNNVDADAIDTSTTYSYEMWDDAKVKTITVDSDTGNYYNALSTSTHYYDGQGRLASVDIGARRHAVSFASGPTGQVLRRLERSSHAYNPVDYYYFVDGQQVGELTNNGWHDPTRDDYTGTIQTRTMKASTSDYPFRWNSYAGATGAQFGGSGYDPISPYSNGMQGSDGRYTVRDGDTLAGIAQQVWGDSSLWYMIAEANGLTSGQTLVAGTSLIVPDKVTNLHNNSSNFQVYDPNKAFGDLNPTTATTTSAKPAKKANKCGMFGAILLIAIAVAVTVVTSGAALAALSPTIGSIGAGISAVAAGSGGFALVAAGAIGGAVGSAVSQGVGVATGLQDKFSWKAVAMAGISGAVSAGVGASGAFAKVGSTFVRGALSGATSNALSQGIGVAVGLQKKFDFAGVAAAGLGAGVSAKVGSVLKAGPWTDMSARNIGANLASSTASAIANAATRSLVQGTNFGDNILAALPDVIGSTIGNMIAFGAVGTAGGAAKPEAGPSFEDIALTEEGRARLRLAGVTAKEPTAADLLRALGPKVEGMGVEEATRLFGDNIAAWIDKAGQRAASTFGATAASIALEKNAALSIVYAAMATEMPNFQWTAVGGIVAPQVGKEIGRLGDIAAGMRTAAIASPVLAVPLLAGAAAIDYVINRLIVGQIDVVTDIGKYALAYRAFGADSVARIGETAQVRTAFTLQGASDRVRANNPARAAVLGREAAYLLGVHEQTRLQAMWDDPFVKRMAQGGSLVGMVSADIHTPVGKISAPENLPGGGPWDLNYRLGVARNAFNFMHDRVFSPAAGRSGFDIMKSHFGNKVQGRLEWARDPLNRT